MKKRTERRHLSVRRDVNDLVRDESGHVSQYKVGSLLGMLTAWYLLIHHAETLIDHWDALVILLTILVAPNAFAKLINTKFGGANGNAK